MAFYDYRCSACGLDIDRRFPITTAPATLDCPACGSPAPRRVSPMRVVFPPGFHDRGRVLRKAGSVPDVEVRDPTPAEMSAMLHG